MIGLRQASLAAIGSLALIGLASPAAAAVIEVVKSATCGCCGKWVEHMRKAGYQVKVANGDPSSAAKRLGVPEDLRSCHTASIGRYAIEGHVPAADVARLIKERPNAAGIAVAGMPLGAPGMETADRPQAFETILFTHDGKRKVFASH